MVLMQAVERWHSVSAGMVPIPGRLGSILLPNCCQSILAGHWLLLITFNRTVYTTPSSFLLPIITQQQGYPTSPRAFSTPAANYKNPVKSQPAVKFQLAAKPTAWTPAP